MTILELRTGGIAKGGEAVAREASGRVVFVEGALPGEVVEAVVVEERKSFARARASRVITASADRVEPPCPNVRAGCGGCDLQHASPNTQRELKLAIVRDALERVARLDSLPPLGFVALPIEGYRTTLRGIVHDGHFALRRRHSHDAVVLGSCLISHPLIDELVRDGRFVDAGEVVLRCGVHTGERIVVASPGAHGVRVPSDVRVVGADELAQGRRAWIHEEVAGHRFRISAASFFQARPDGAEALVAAVTAAAGPIDATTRVVDAYAGVGLFSATVAGAAGSVTAVERSPSSIADARVNLATHSGRTRIVRSAVERWRAEPADLVIADPARAGLGKQAVDRLTATGAGRFVLVSCDPASAARDAGLLVARGYRLASATLVDLFGHTSHIELVTAFER